MKLLDKLTLDKRDEISETNQSLLDRIENIEHRFDKKLESL